MFVLYVYYKGPDLWCIVYIGTSSHISGCVEPSLYMRGPRPNRCIFFSKLLIHTVKDYNYFSLVSKKIKCLNLV